MPIEFRTRSKGNQPDPNDVGACCKLKPGTDEFVCEDNIKFLECKRELGLFRGKGSDCVQDPCPAVEDSGIPDDQGLNNFNSDQHGACVRCSGCIENVTEDFCIDTENFDAVFYGGKVCVETTALDSTKKACCIDEGCFDTCNKAYCLELGGIYHDGILTELEVTCSSNPCGSQRLPSSQEIGSCCKGQKCLGILTEVDCLNNGGSWKGQGTDCNVGGNYNCITDQLIGETRTPVRRDPTTLGSSGVVCSKPTTTKYYTPDGRWSGAELPKYTDEELDQLSDAAGNEGADFRRTYLKPRESVLVELYPDEETCVGDDGIVTSLDGDINKGIMWGGCQWYDTNPDNTRWRCESKTFDQCATLKGIWQAGIYCDEITNWPVTGKLLADTLTSGVGAKLLAGTCYVIDNIQNADSFEPGESVDNVECQDMRTEYECYEVVARRKDVYASEGVDEVYLADDDFLRGEWTPGKKCTDCTEGVNETPDILGLCLLDTTQTGSHYRSVSGQNETFYTFKTGTQRACLSGFTSKDCFANYGTWVNTCETCEEYDSTYPEPVATGSCCTSSTNCLDGKTFPECEALNGFFHGPGTVCTDVNGNSRDCGKVAFLTTDMSEFGGSLNPAVCQCKESDNPSASNPNVVSIFARTDTQDLNDIWAGSQCGDPTVSAIPLFNPANGYKDSVLGLYSLEPATETPSLLQIFTDSRELSKEKYNWYHVPFRDFIRTGVDGEEGSFLDSILIEGKSLLFYRIDGKEPFPITRTFETSKALRGKVLQTNQPTNSITSLILNEPRFGFDNAPPASHRKITYVNLEGMSNLRQFGVQGDNWTTLQSDFEAAELPLLRILDLRGSNLSGLVFDNAPAIESLNLNGNNITGSYDLSSLTYLTELDLSYNNLSNIDFGSEDKIYLTDLRTSYNTNLSSIQGSFPQIQSFNVNRCNITDIDLSTKPYLSFIELIGNPLNSVKISGTPSISYLGLSNTFNEATSLTDCVLPTLVNRTLTTGDLPDSIRGGSNPDDGAIIPQPTYITKLNFRKNTISGLNYDAFARNLAETVAITVVSKFTQTNFTTVGDLGTRASGSAIYCKEIDFSQVTESATDDSSSVLELLKYLFQNATAADLQGIDISGGETLRIILTGINTSVRWESDLGQALQDAIPQDIYNNLALII